MCLNIEILYKRSLKKLRVLLELMCSCFNVWGQGHDSQKVLDKKIVLTLKFLTVQEFCHKVKIFFFLLRQNGIHKRSWTKICLRFCHNFKNTAGQT